MLLVASQCDGVTAVVSASVAILIVPTKKLISRRYASESAWPFNAAPRWRMQPLQPTPLSGAPINGYSLYYAYYGYPGYYGYPSYYGYYR